MKRCPTCEVTKETTEFSKGGKHKPFHYQCKECAKKWRQTQPKEWHEKEKIRCRIKTRKKAGLNPFYEGKYRNTPLPNPETAWKDRAGYVLIYRPEHKNCRKNGLICQHVFIMSNHLGRPLIKGENVHHKNGIKDDNRLENLELWNRNQPPGQRVEDKIAWCKEFLAQYGYNVTVRINVQI